MQIAGGAEIMTDKQWDGMLLMTAEIVKGSKSKEDALKTILRLVRGKAALDEDGEPWEAGKD
jgi:hypothetical protein